MKKQKRQHKPVYTWKSISCRHYNHTLTTKKIQKVILIEKICANFTKKKQYVKGIKDFKKYLLEID